MLASLNIKPPPKKIFSSHEISLRNLHDNRSFSLASPSSAKPLSRLRCTHNFHIYGPLRNGFSLNSRVLVLKAQGEGVSGKQTDDKSSEGDDEIEARGESTMPERFRYLSKEGTDKPIRWPFLVVLAFMLYAWRTVIWELSNWRKAISSIFKFFLYISKLLLALIFHFVGSPLTSLIQAIETSLYTIRAFYSSIIAYAPIKELTIIIILTSTVLSISEAAVPGSVDGQPYLLTLAGLIGFLAVRSYISELFFWALLIGLFCYSRFVKKRDYVSSALPVAAILAGVGEPWVRAIAMVSFGALAVLAYRGSADKSRLGESEIAEGEGKGRGDGAIERVPIPLLCAGLAIGVRVAAKWAGYRHLTWMIV